MATKQITFKVLPEDIEGAKILRPGNCVIARCMQRTLHNPNITCGTRSGGTSLVEGDDLDAQFPWDVTDYIKNFDHTGKAEPGFEFTLDVPEALILEP